MLTGIRACAAAILLLSCLAVPARATDFQILTVDDPPFSYMDAEHRPAGFSVDVVNELRKRLGAFAPVRMLPERRVMESAESRPGMLFFGFSRTPERETRFHWIARLLQKPWVFYFRSHARAVGQDAGTIKSLRLGVVMGDVREEWARSRGYRVDGAANPEANLRRLLLDRVDCIFTDPASLAAECGRVGCDASALGAVYSGVTTDVWLAMSQGTPEAVVRAWQDAARAMTQDGTFRAIAQRWSERLAKEHGLASQALDDGLVFTAPGGR